MRFLCDNCSIILITIYFAVIEVSCGEYGDNIKNLVNAINNGKYDIREGHSFPETKEEMNNCAASTGILKNGDSIEKLKIKDKNDVNNLEEKFLEEKANEISNGKLISGYATNDIAKQGINAFLRLYNKLQHDIVMICNSCKDDFSINIIYCN